MIYLVDYSDEMMALDQRMFRIILENHILKSKFTLGQLYNGQRLETIGGKFMRVFIYRTVSLPVLWLFVEAESRIQYLNLTLWLVSAGCVHRELLFDQRQ